MAHRIRNVLPLGCVLLNTAIAWSLAAGCQSKTASNAGDGGSGGGSTDTSATATTTGGGASTTATGTGGSGGGPLGCEGQDATITDVTKGNVGTGVKVHVQGAVAMSHKFLVSQSKSTGSCLWGVYLSEPGLAETQAYSGVLFLSYGTDAVVNDAGKAYCPVLGVDPAGDKIPDDVQPGDVLDLVGETSSFLLSQCSDPASNPTNNSVPQRQIAKGCMAVKTGTAALPAPHVMTGADFDGLSSPTDTTAHDKWGGVKVRIQNVTTVPQTDSDGNPSITDGYGAMVLQGTTLTVNDKIYYQGLLKSQGQTCHAGPEYSDPMTTFTSIDGFSMVDFCTWSLSPEAKCDDFVPAGTDCPCSN